MILKYKEGDNEKLLLIHDATAQLESFWLSIIYKMKMLYSVQCDCKCIRRAFTDVIDKVRNRGFFLL